MKRIVLALALAIGFIAGAPVVAPNLAAQASAIMARTTDGVLIYTWYWVPYPGQNPPGAWVLINVEPA